MSTSPGIFYNSKFVVGGNKGALEYADDRDKLPDHLRTSLFLNYMDNPKKASGLINMEGRYVTPEERERLSHQFDLAEEAGSLLWQDLFSFDHDWLAKHGMYDARTNTFDLVRISKAIIAAETYIFEKEQYQQPVGCFAFHVNTDHLHAHFSMMELVPSREKKWFQTVDKKTGEVKRQYQPVGARDKSTIKGAKRIFANRLLRHDQELTRITDLIRQTIVATLPKKEVWLHPAFEEAFLVLYQKLPMQRNRWQYGYAKGQHFQQEIDHLIQLHLDTFYEEDYRDLVQKITSLDQTYQETYKGVPHGQSVHVIHEDGRVISEQNIPELEGNFTQTKLQELYSKMGNALLREIKQMDQEMRQKGFNPKEYFGKRRLKAEVTEALEPFSAPLPEGKKRKVSPEWDFKSLAPQTKEEHFQEVWMEQGKQANRPHTEARRAYKQALQRPHKQTYRSPEEFRRAVETEKVLRRMQKAFYKDYKTWKNEQAFEALQRDLQFHHHYT
ncbi:MULTISPECIES: MobP2 family relaxase [Listeria]|uniref:MobP2 family relaxase n=1 Tax=Listeria TaxID=1637 RepID=UPI000B58CD2D|nr:MULTISPECIES: MobP2 family relaxase [Listeria]